MPERAEIEAVARAFGYRPSKPHQTIARQEQWQRGLRLAANALEALDRVRDARGDDEAARSLGEFTPEQRERIERRAEEIAAQLEAGARSPQGDEPRKLVIDWTEEGHGLVLDPSTYPMRVVGTHSLEREAARFSQGEDREAPEFDEQAITDILVAIDDTLWGCGRERMDLIDGPTVDALRDAVKRELVAFVARSAPSRDGTVAEIVRRLRYSDGIAPDAAVREIADWIESQYAVGVASGQVWKWPQAKP